MTVLKTKSESPGACGLRPPDLDHHPARNAVDYHVSEPVAASAETSAPSHGPTTAQAMLSNIPSDGVLVLFSPTTHLGAQRPDRSSQDPFEHFGRALGRYLPRIRHVPYDPCVGLTRAHQEFIYRADAVIVVSASSNFLRNGSTEPPPDEHHGIGDLEKQFCIADDVSLSGRYSLGALERAQPVPTIHVMVDCFEGLPRLPTEIRSRASVIQKRPNSEEDLSALAESLFKRDRAASAQGEDASIPVQDPWSLGEKLRISLRLFGGSD